MNFNGKHLSLDDRKKIEEKVKKLGGGGGNTPRQ